ncbi:cell cycle checkpoint control protein Rad9 [Brevipalpus obovatus]|uniref:cell cycle checkpoint control protein Rad9 n=1 Tax=Brevipalpus obovatus TaxID=246614 RepID=UPI003D9E9D1D
MLFTCQVGSLSIKSFTQAINACSKLGEDVHLDATSSRLTVQTMNTSKSALLEISFDRGNFDEYQVTGRAEFVLKKRSCILAFKKEPFLTKHLDHLLIEVEEDAEHVRFVFNYKQKYLKDIRLPIPQNVSPIEVEAPEEGMNVLTCRKKLLMDIVNDFAREDELVTLRVESRNLHLKTHSDGEKADKTTKLSFKADEFERFDVKDPVSLTFSIRLVRPFIAFLMSRDMVDTVNILIGTPGQAFFFQAEEPPSIKVSLALATVAYDEENESEPATRSTPSQSTERTYNSQLHPDCNIDVIQSTPRESQQPNSSQNRSPMVPDPSLSRIDDGHQADEPMETNQVEIIGSAGPSRRLSQRSSQRSSLSRSVQSSQRSLQASNHDSSSTVGDISENRRSMKRQLSDPSQQSQDYSPSQLSSHSHVSSPSLGADGDDIPPEFTQEELEDACVTNDINIAEPDYGRLLSPTDSEESSELSN